MVVSSFEARSSGSRGMFFCSHGNYYISFGIPRSCDSGFYSSDSRSLVAKISGDERAARGKAQWSPAVLRHGGGSLMSRDKYILA